MDLKPAEKLAEFTEKMRGEFKNGFADEQQLANTLFDLYYEATVITTNERELERETNELITRLFNDMYAGWQLVTEGLPFQAMILFRTSIECIFSIKLMEIDSGFRDEWSKGKDFYFRDIKKRLKKAEVSGPILEMLEKLYGNLSRDFVHPSKKGMASHVVDIYQPGTGQRTKYALGSVNHKLKTDVIASSALNTMAMNTFFLWRCVFPIDEVIHQEWHNKLNTAVEQLQSLKSKSDKAYVDFLINQLNTLMNIEKDRFEAAKEEAREVFGE